MSDQRLTRRRRRRWCYECQRLTLTHRYTTALLEGEIDLCDECEKDGSRG